MAGTKILTRNPTTGAREEKKTPQTSADTPAAGDIAALNTNGKYSTDLLPVVTTSAGAGDAGKLPVLDGAGKLDPTTMPTGIGADTHTFVTSEALTAGDWTNTWDDTGTPKIRKADGSAPGKECDSFVLASYASGATATAYFSGTNTSLSGLTGGKPVYLSTSTPGAGQQSVPTGAGKVHQKVAKATSATAAKFDPDEEPITLV